MSRQTNSSQVRNKGYGEQSGLIPRAGIVHALGQVATRNGKSYMFRWANGGQAFGLCVAVSRCSEGGLHRGAFGLGRSPVGKPNRKTRENPISRWASRWASPSSRIEPAESCRVDRRAGGRLSPRPAIGSSWWASRWARGGQTDQFLTIDSSVPVDRGDGVILAGCVKSGRFSTAPRASNNSIFE